MTDASVVAPALSIVVPVYNGASTVGELVHALRALDIVGGLEIVLVVDGSPDNSLDVCKKLAAEPGAPVTILSLSRNYGEHNAVMAGLARARAYMRAPPGVYRPRKGVSSSRKPFPARCDRVIWFIFDRVMSVFCRGARRRSRYRWAR